MVPTDFSNFPKMAVPTDMRPLRDPRSRRSSRQWMAVAGVAFVLVVACVGGYMILAAWAILDKERPRQLPRGYVISTVNGDWHFIGLPGGMIVFPTGEGGHPTVIGKIGVVGDLVVGTLRDGSGGGGEGYFVFDAASGNAIRSADYDAWAAELGKRGIKSPPDLSSPLGLPKAD